MSIVRYFVVFVCLLCAGNSYGQMLGWELGGWIGGSNYFGDLNTNYRLNRIQLAGGVMGRYNFNERLCFRLGANLGSIKAFDSDSKNVYEQRRNLSFKSLIAEGMGDFEFNFLPYVHGHREYFYTPYVYLGLGWFYFNPKTKLDGTWYNLREFGTEGQFKGEEYNTIQTAIHYGLGFKIDLNYRWSINVEASARKIFTDYLDDVSKVYPDMGDLESQRGETAVMLSDRSEIPQIGQPGRQRGNGKKNDFYGMVGVGVMYYFGSIRCPAPGGGH